MAICTPSPVKSPSTDALVFPTVCGMGDYDRSGTTAVDGQLFIFTRGG